MAENNTFTATEADKEALKRLTRSVSLAGFIMWDVMQFDEFAALEDGNISLEQLYMVGWNAVRSAELVATSAAEGAWPEIDAEQEVLYASKIQPWLDSLEQPAQDSVRNQLYGNTT